MIMARDARRSASLYRWLAGPTLALACLHVLLFAAWRASDVLVVLPWYVPMIHSFLALAAACITFLAFGRFAVLREPRTLWVGIAFGTFAIYSVFYVLSWPNLLPDGKGLITNLLNTSGWFWHLQFTALAVFLLVALLIPEREPNPDARKWRLARLLGLALALLIGWLSVVFEPNLPLLVIDGRFTRFNGAWSLALLVCMIAGTVVAARKYQETGNRMLYYLALTELVFAFAVLVSIVGGRYYDLLWYWQRVLWVGALSIMLFGLLLEYISLYRRELHFAEIAGQHAAELSTTLDSMADAVIVADRSGRVINLNRVAREVLSIEPSMEFAASAPDVVDLLQLRTPSGREIEREEHPFVLALDGQAVIGDEVILRLANGKEMYVSANVSPVRNQAGKTAMAVAVLRNVTELKRLETLREEFMSAAAHELKTPITTIKGYSQLMSGWVAKYNDPRAQDAMERIAAQCDRIDRRVQEMMAAVRSYSAPLELRSAAFDLGALAEDVVEHFQAKNGRLVSFSRNGPTPVEMDRDRIEEVVASLLDNAARYSAKDSPIEMIVSAHHGVAILSVADHGVGIRKDRQEGVFEPFYEAVPAGDPGYQGVVGLSLHLSKIAVERHRGRMWFESEEGKGSTFYVSLPLISSAPS